MLISLEERTQKYWAVSRAWNNQGDWGEPNFTAHEAIDTCNDILFISRPNSMLDNLTFDLRERVINFGNKEHQQNIEARGV